MDEQCDIKNILDTASRIFLYCIVFGILLMLVWFLFFLLFGGFAYGIHSKLFAISREQFDFANYLLMGIAKLIVISLYLVPYISIRLALRKLH